MQNWILKCRIIKRNKLMKRLLLGISVVALMMTASCGNKAEQDRIAQLEAEIAKLKGEDYRESSSASNDENYSLPSTSQETDNSSLSNNEKSSRFTGRYQFTDKSGNVWIVNLKDDETATMNIKGDSFLYYAEWDEFPYGVPCLKFGFDDAPYANFPSGRESMYYACITEDYIYNSNSSFSAKNPRKRLPIKKIK